MPARTFLRRDRGRCARPLSRSGSPDRVGGGESWSFALAGGNALVAHGLLVRPTEDVDLFTTAAGGPGEAGDAVAQSLREQGYEVVTEAAPDGDFVRLRVQRGVESVVVDLARRELQQVDAALRLVLSL